MKKLKHLVFLIKIFFKTKKIFIIPKNKSIIHFDSFENKQVKKIFHPDDLFEIRCTVKEENLITFFYHLKFYFMSFRNFKRKFNLFLLHHFNTCCKTENNSYICSFNFAL